MNIAIIIGVSVYSDSKNNLPGCKNDAEAIYQILKRTEKFDNILYINESETSAKTKGLLTNFISENQGKSIDELFFYFSGHGEFTNDEFYYILSDYDSKKKNQTSLQNSEIDSLIRTLSPELIIKVIDACHSGTTYIKENNVLNKYFDNSKKGFKKCYFLNSSLNNQSSFQDKNISFFTLSFIKALIEHNTDEIRYKDIIDVISDEFANNQDQTPFFIIQAALTEKFCTFSKNLKEYLRSFNSPIDEITESKDKPLSLAELVKSKAKEYVDKDGAIKSIEFIRSQFNMMYLSPKISELFNLEITFLEDHKTIPQTKVIANWLQKNRNDFFATLVYEEMYHDETGEEYTIMTGFDLKLDTPFKAISIEINSLFPNLFSYQCTIVFFISKRLLRFFFFITNYIEESWEQKRLNTKDIKWLTAESKIANETEIKGLITTIKYTIDSRIIKDIEEQFPIQNDTSEGNDLPFQNDTSEGNDLPF